MAISPQPAFKRLHILRTKRERTIYIVIIVILTWSVRSLDLEMAESVVIF